MVIVWRPGYRIDSRTIKGGSQVSSSIVSFVESSNHLHPCIIIFLGPYLVFLYVSFWAYGLHRDKFKLIENWFRMHHIVFLVLEILPDIYWEGHLSYPSGIYSPLLVLNLSSHCWIAFVVLYSTSLSLLKSELVCKSCGCFSIICFTLRGCTAP